MKEKRSFKEKTKRLIQPLVESPSIFRKASIHNTVYGITGILFIIFIQKVFFTLNSGSIQDLYYLIFIFAIIYSIQQVILLFIIYDGWTGLIGAINKFVYKKYLPKFILIDNNYFEKIGTGKSIAIIGKGVKTWGLITEQILMTGTNILIGFIFTFYVISSVSVYLSLLFIGLLIIGFYISIYLNSKIIFHRNKRVYYDNLATKHLVKILMSKFEILQSNKIKKELKYLEKKEDQKTDCYKKLSFPMTLLFNIPDIIIFIILTITFLYFGNLYFSGVIELSILVGISGALILMQKNSKDLMFLFKDVTRDFAEIETMWDFFDNSPEIKGYNKGKEFQYKKGYINIENLNYSYSKSNNIFSNLSLKIKGEEVTAIVGSSGGGKSTLVKLISGYIRQKSGKISVDNQDLTTVSLKSYYSSIGYLTQDPSIFDGTIYENLSYASEGKISDDILKKNILLAECGFIYDLPKGIETEIGEKGIKLSGGQKQRLAIAKIFLKNPDIIILDEPTSALDSFSEEKITKAMKNLFKNRTVIVIAHRLQTVKHADRILVLEQGQIVEDGNHVSLKKKKGIYYKMLELQSGF